LGQAPLVEGNPASSVRVVVYEDLQCSDCAAFRKMMDEKLLPKYGAKVAFEHRDFPLVKHAWARKGALAARHFQSIKPELGIAWRRETLANMALITPESFADHLVAFALKSKQDPEKAKAALTDANLAKALDAETAEGVARGIARTPTVFVNGEPFIETFTLEEISKAIDSQLAAGGPK
jgi:protein-disulfide isomerase